MEALVYTFLLIGTLMVIFFAVFQGLSVYQGLYLTDWGMIEIPIIPDDIDDE